MSTTPPALGDDESPISAADMARASGKARALYGDFGLATASTVKAFAAQVRRDTDLLRKTWPDTERCVTVAALEALVMPLKELTERVAQAGREMAASGIRRLVADQYKRVADGLVRDVSGSRGIGPMLFELQEAKRQVAAMGVDADAATICITRRDLLGGNPLRSATFFTLGRVAIALETYADLEDVRPWFAKNAVFDAAFTVFFTIGKLTVATVEKTGQIVNSLDDMVRATAETLSRIVEIAKISTIATAGYLLWRYVLRDKKKGRSP